MRPLTLASKNFNIALTIANEITVEKGATYVGSEHFVYAFLCLPGCHAYGILAGEGVTRNEYEELFFKSIDKHSKFSGLTRRTQSMYDKAVDLAEETGTKAGTAHMLYAILQTPDCVAVKILQQFAEIGVLIEKTKSALLSLKHRSAFGELHETESNVNPLTSEYTGDRNYTAKNGQVINEENGKADKKQSTAPTREKGGAFDKAKQQTNNKLSAYGTDMTERARRGKYDPVIGRDKEIEKVIQVLSRRSKNNPVLIGEPGVGKSAIVEGLSQLIVAEKVPGQLYNKTIFSVDLAGMLSGARYRGDFEERLKDMVDTVMQDGDVVLFIDEIHMIVGAGSSSENGMDVANILKPLLSRGDLQVIGATTIEEYRKYIEKDSALERRFTPVMVEEPSIKDAISILKGLRGKYEEHHDIVITDDAIETAVKLSARYITDRFLPDKAIDLIDEAAARVRILEDGGAEIALLKKEIIRLEEERLFHEKRGEYPLATKSFQKQRELKEKLVSLQKAQAPLVLADGRQAIGGEQVSAIISARMQIPLTKITQEEGEKLVRLEEELHRRIIGQNEAVTAVAQAIRRARAGLKDPSKPIGSFIFVGPTGVGKTDLCKALAQALFGTEDQMIRLDMSEFMEKQSVSKLIGAPPGYVGYEDTQSGQLTEKVRTKPYSVILFDEIEKAHPDVFNLLLQILDDGRLTDSKGRTVSFKNAVIILTSNTGASLGDNTQSYVDENGYEMMKERITSALKEKFKPEFLNRMDDVIVFHSLSKADCQIIAGKIVESLARRIHEQRGITLSVTESALRALVDEGYDAQYGARPLKRAVQRRIENTLSNEILLGKIQNGEKVLVDYRDDKYTFSTQK